MAEDAIRDGNFVTSILLESSTNPGVTVRAKGDEVTGRLLVDLPGGSGTVTSVSVVTANGFAGTVANATTTPAITLTTSITGILKGNGTAVSAVTIGSGLSYDGTTLSATGSGITIGTTTITSGTNTRILYNNSGVVGEYTLTGTGTVVAMQTSPTFVTPILGTPTSGTLTNCTGYVVGNISGLGTGVATFLATPSSANLASAVTDETGSGLLVFGTSPVLTTPTITTSIVPTSNDGATLGSTTNQFSDLYLAEGGVINFDNGDMTLTQANNLLSLAGGEFSFGANTAGFDVTDNGNSGTSDTIDWKLGNKQKSTFTGNCTFTFTAPTKACSLILECVQDGTVRTITWPSTVKWPGGVAPTFTGTSGRSDIVTFYWNGSVYYGNSTLNFVNS